MSGKIDARPTPHHRVRGSTLSLLMPAAPGDCQQNLQNLYSPWAAGDIGVDTRGFPLREFARRALPGVPGLITAATVNSHVESAIGAMETENWSLALRKLMAAKAAISALADHSHGDSSLRWDRAAIDSLIKDVRSQSTSAAVASGGIRKSKIHFNSEGRC